MEMLEIQCKRQNDPLAYVCSLLFYGSPLRKNEG